MVDEDDVSSKQMEDEDIFAKSRARADRILMYKTMAAGALAASLAKLSAQPFEVTKIRLQLQVEPIKGGLGSKSKYHSLPHAMRTIYREEGFRAFWKGWLPAQGISLVYGGVQFSIFEHLFKITKDTAFHHSYPNFNLFLCGAFAGSVSTCVSQPIDLTKTRIIAEDKKNYKTFVHALIGTAREEGFPALYQGLVPALIEVFPLAGLNFMFYRFFTKKFMSLFKVEERHELPVWSLLVTGAVSAVMAKTATYPLDLARKRSHVQGFQSKRKGFGKSAVCKQLYTCLLNVVKNESFFGLYKGLVPTLLKSAVTSAVMFPTYDLLKVLFENFL